VSTNELLRRRGYHATSLSQISDAAGATIGSIYHFFPEGKEALAAEVIRTTGAIYQELFESILESVSDPADAYAEFFAQAAQTLEDSDFIDPCPIGTVAREVASTSATLREAAADVFSSWIDAARRRLERSGLEPEVAHRIAITAVATVEGTFVLSRTLRDTTPLIAAGETIARLIRTANTDRATAPT
jgi:AcrR family transcriptional regulator